MVSSTDEALETSAGSDKTLNPIDDVQTDFSKILQDFRINFGENDLKSVVAGFKHVCYENILRIESDDTVEIDDSALENWVLEGRLWTLLESLLDVKFMKDLSNKEQVGMSNKEMLSTYTSNTVLLDRILEEKSDLFELFTIYKALLESSNLDIKAYPDTNIDDIQASKWLNSKLEIQSGRGSEQSICELDADAATRSGKKLSPKDIEMDEAFFSRAFRLLLCGDLENLTKLSRETGNQNFALIGCGLREYVNPAVDLIDTSSKPMGIKHKLLWRRTVYNLIKSGHSKAERACYGYLCGDFESSSALVHSWDDKLLVYLNNLLQSRLDDELIKSYKILSKTSEINLCFSLSVPPMVATSIKDALNKLAQDSDESTRTESQHPIRVIIGSILSDNVPKLMQSTIQYLGELSSSKDMQNNDIAKVPHLLRILTHLAIILQLIYGEKVVSNFKYSEIIKSYIILLVSQKRYDQIPLYISFIPNDEILIDTYSNILSSLDLAANQRESQIRLMEQLYLPKEAILRATVTKCFGQTEKNYPVDQEVTLNMEVTYLDKKFYHCIYWFYDSGMSTDCLEAVVMLMRRFLTCGKLQAAVEFMNTIALPSVIQHYKRKVTIVKEDDTSMKQYLIPKSKLSELVQYQHLITAFGTLDSFEIGINLEGNADDLKKVVKMAAVLDELLKTWMFDLSMDDTLPQEDHEMYCELRRTYIPAVFTTLFELLVKYRSLSQDMLYDQAINMINTLADENYKFYELLNSANQLKPFLQRFSEVSSMLYGERKQGIYH